jgi:hypothetical protein
MLQSPTVNFGRMPISYVMSSGNNANLVAVGKRFRGGLSSDSNSSHLPSISPTGGLIGDPLSASWCGHQWSSWLPIAEVLKSLNSSANGLYRLHGAEHSKLLYVGQGMLRSRLSCHLQKALNPENEQGTIFANTSSLECSWVQNDNWYPHQRLELENDLIASHLLVTEVVPSAQFLG